MPIYEYLCEDCGERYERIVKNEKSAVTCPKCSSPRRTIQLSVFAAPAGSRTSGGSSSPAGHGGGCCGGACGCN